MKTQINEELNLIKYLFDYKKGKVISEQMITEENGQTVEEYPICVQKYGQPTSNGSYYSIIGKDEFKDSKFYSNYRVATSGGMKDYYCSGDKVVLGKNPTPVKNEKEVVAKVSPQTNDATNIQTKLVELGQDIGPKGVDGRIGPNTMKAIWAVIKDIQK